MCFFDFTPGSISVQLELTKSILNLMSCRRIDSCKAVRNIYKPAPPAVVGELYDRIYILRDLH